MSGKTFPGFPDRLAYLPVPVPLFGALLREINDLAELKLTLHAWRLLHQQKGSPRFLRRSLLQADRALLAALRDGTQRSPGEAVSRALEAACQRGTLLELQVEVAGGDERQHDVCYFLNTPAHRRLIERIQLGEATLGDLQPVAVPVPPPLPRPGIYELYEQNIGLLTPLIAEELREAEQQYPAEWIDDAFREAVAYNKRNWRYIRRILENWATRGRGERGEDRGYPQPPEDPARYFQGRYGRLIKR